MLGSRHLVLDSRFTCSGGNGDGDGASKYYLVTVYGHMDVTVILFTWLMSRGCENGRLLLYGCQINGL